MKSITLTILLFALVIVANAENPAVLTEERQDIVQDVQEPVHENEDNLIASRNDEETFDEDSIRKVSYFYSNMNILL